jgi:hypothetical protein
MTGKYATVDAMRVDKGTWEKTCPSATLSTTNPKSPDLGSNPGSPRPTYRYRTCDKLITVYEVLPMFIYRCGISQLTAAHFVGGHILGN